MLFDGHRVFFMYTQYYIYYYVNEVFKYFFFIEFCFIWLGVVKHRAFFCEITEGFASASPDYETTSQQDNEWDFASPDYETTSQQDYKWDFASQTSDKSHETKETLAL